MPRISRSTALSTVALTLAMFASAEGRKAQTETTQDSAMPQLVRSMDAMHAALAQVRPSGNNDVNFVRLMLPHHQAALDMAKVEVASGTDPQMRRLAQEIITDQQSEIELMQRWLKQHQPASPAEGAPHAAKERK